MLNAVSVVVVLRRILARPGGTSSEERSPRQRCGSCCPLLVHLGKVLLEGYDACPLEGPQSKQALVAGHNDFRSASYCALQDAVIRFLLCDAETASGTHPLRYV